MYKKKLLELGMPADISGFEFLNFAIDKYNPPQSNMKLYEIIANRFNSTVSKSERAMRYAIAQTGEAITVSQFIAKYKILWSN